MPACPAGPSIKVRTWSLGGHGPARLKVLESQSSLRKMCGVVPLGRSLKRLSRPSDQQPNSAFGSSSQALRKTTVDQLRYALPSQRVGTLNDAVRRSP